MNRATTSNSVSRLLKYAALIYGVLGCCVLVEEVVIKKNLPPGVLLGSLELISSLTAALFVFWSIKRDQLLKDYKIALGFLGFFFLLLGIADGTYFVRYYFLGLSDRTFSSFFFASLPYSISYLLAASAIIWSIRGRLKGFFLNPLFIIPLSLTFPVLVKFLLPAVYNTIQHGGFDIFVIGKLMNTFSSFILINLSIMVLLTTRSFFWSFWGTGATTLILVNWALGTELLMGQLYQFGFYEYFWAYGVLLCAIPIILEKGGSLEAYIPERSSIVTQSRISIFAVIAVSLICASSIPRFTLDSIKLISLGVSLGCLSSIIISQMLAAQITHFSSEMGMIVNQGHVEQIGEGYLKKLPVELQESFDALFAKQIESERNRRLWNSKLSELSAHIAHDIRTPLSVLKAYVWTKNMGTGDLCAEYHMAATRSVDRLLDMANELVAYSKATIINRSGVIIKKMLCDIIFSLSGASCARNNVEFVVESSDELQVNVDASKCERVLSNLISNAVESITHDHGKVVVRATEANENDLVISVIDNGKGIEARHFPHIFDSFYSAGKRAGTGLGLSYCKQVVEAHGGTIGVKSEIGKGSTFTICMRGCVMADIDE